MHRIMMSISRGMAILGGIVLTLLIVLTCVSVLGRGMNTFLHWDVIEGAIPGVAKTLQNTFGPVLGDYELVEAGIAFSIFAFMPLCTITAGHASVDIVTMRFGARVNRFISVIVGLLFAGVFTLIALRLYEGMASKMEYNETTFLIQFPIWWAYALSLFGAAVTAVVGIYMAVVRIIEFATMRTIAEGAEVEH
ncbi:TRAP transporter small permease [Rhodobacteraceae bacterium 10Alg 79]|uniref:TRAP transporter small permease protein n=1 Tax=Rhodalgimonas zhirmunskyi TaxID=2964767 RepID=A0AAJ1X6A5_9RHOB|nr:TRAP transporter small permease [Rhodoalgimonas zhirmunskyi]